MADTTKASLPRRWYRLAMQILLVLSLLGLGVSLWAHSISLLGYDPGRRFKGFWIFQLLLFVLVIPIVFELFHKQPEGGLLRSPRWMRLLQYVLLFYYGIHFYVFLYWSAEHLSSAVTWRMFSAGWILLFAVAAVYYRVRWMEANHR